MRARGVQIPSGATVNHTGAALCFAPQRRAVFALILASFVWGTSDVVGKIALGTIPPVTLAAVRFAVALIILWSISRYRGARLILNGQSAVLGVTGVALTFLFQNEGLTRTTAANASLLQGAVPVIVLLLASLYLGERLTVHRVWGVGIALVGVTVMTLVGRGTLAAPRMGDALVLASAGCFAAFVMLGRRAFAEHGTLPVLTGMLLWSLVVLLPAAVLELSVVARPVVGLHEAGLMLYLGAGCSALTYGLWGYALRHLEASRAVIFDNVIPVVGLAAAVLFLGERPTIWHLAGGALVITGVWFVSHEVPTSHRIRLTNGLNACDSGSRKHQPAI
jgi:drug/metabolite transporter (DMT)-like permease